MPGYEVRSVHPLLKRHECPICLLPMKNPVQTECGHLFCRDCLEPVLKHHHPICPLDKDKIPEEGTFPDNACRREILKLQVYCHYQSGGCLWLGPLKEVENHVSTCDYRDVQCTLCGLYVQQFTLDAHQNEQCPMRPITCQHCKKDVPVQQLQTHVDKLCPKVLHSCPNSCDSKLQMNLQDLEKHIDLKTGTCPLSEVECVFGGYGCKFKSLRKNLKAHLEQNEYYHAQIRDEGFDDIPATITTQSLSMNHVLERVGSLETHANNLERLQGALEQYVEFPHQITPTPLQGFGDTNVSPQRIEALHTRVVELEHSVDRALSSCLEQELRIQLLERATYNGILLWKIDEFDRRRHEAVNGVTMSLYSTPFFTSRHGYKLRARLDLKEGKMGKGSHLHVIFYLDGIQQPVEFLSNRKDRHTHQNVTLKDVLLVTRSVVRNWKELGLHLNVPEDRLDTIDVDKRFVDDKKYAMFKYWLENEENPSWEKLANAVKQIGKDKLAKEIRHEDCQPPPDDHKEKKSFRGSVKEGARKIWGTLKEHTVDKIKGVLGRFGELIGIRRKYKTNKIDDSDQRKVRWWFEIAGDESVLRVLEAQWKTITASEQWRLEGVQAQPNRS